MPLWSGTRAERFGADARDAARKLRRPVLPSARIMPPSAIDLTRRWNEGRLASTRGPLLLDFDFFPAPRSSSMATLDLSSSLGDFEAPATGFFLGRELPVNPAIVWPRDGQGSARRPRAGAQPGAASVTLTHVLEYVDRKCDHEQVRVASAVPQVVRRERAAILVGERLPKGRDGHVGSSSG